MTYRLRSSRVMLQRGPHRSLALLSLYNPESRKAARGPVFWLPDHPILQAFPASSASGVGLQFVPGYSDGLASDSHRLPAVHDARTLREPPSSPPRLRSRDEGHPRLCKSRGNSPGANTPQRVAAGPWCCGRLVSCRIDSSRCSLAGPAVCLRWSWHSRPVGGQAAWPERIVVGPTPPSVASSCPTRLVWRRASVSAVCDPAFTRFAAPTPPRSCQSDKRNPMHSAVPVAARR